MKYEFSINKFLIILFILVLVITWSPLFGVIIPFNNAYLTLIFNLLLIILFYYKHKKINKTILILSSILFSSIILVSFFAGSISYITRLIWLPLALIITKYINHELLIKTSKIFTYFVFILLLGAWFSFFYSFFGGDPLFVYSNMDSKSIFFYGGTFTNASLFGIIRPAGIYDEPGAFSFVIWILILLRHKIYDYNKITILLAILGLITFSLTHFICLAIYLISYFFKNKINHNTRYFLFIFLILLTIFFLYIKNNIPEVNFFFDRFNIEDGKVSGDNRSEELINFFKFFNLKMFLIGVPLCSLNREACGFIYGSVSANPFTPIFYNGFICTWPYYLLVVVLLYTILNKKIKMPFIILLLLILQRPYFMELGYSLMILIIVKIYYTNFKILN
jgi:hypothetical protein